MEGDREMKTISVLNKDADVLEAGPPENWGSTSTIFDLFEGDYSIKLVTIKLECPVCGHTWGVKLDDYDEYHQIPDRKFVCQNCRHQR
jgi:hypothetical protein